MRGIVGASLGATVVLAFMLAVPLSAQGPQGSAREYRLVSVASATAMQATLNEAAATGFRFAGIVSVDGGLGMQVSVIVTKAGESAQPSAYRVVLTDIPAKTQADLEAAGDAGFDYRARAAFAASFGREETAIILERRDQAHSPTAFQYRLFFASGTDELEGQLAEAGAEGFAVVDVMVGRRLFGRQEIMSILRRPVSD